MENKHTYSDLAQMQSISLDAKMRMSQYRVDQWIEEFGEDGAYVSVSGGKDSQVLYHFVTQYCGYKNIKAVFVNTGLEYDCVRKNGEDMASVILRPEMDFLNVIKTYGYPIFGKEISQAIYDVRVKYKRKYGITSGFIDKLKNEDNLTIKEQQLLGTYQYKDEKSPYCKDKYLFALDAPFLIGNRCCSVMKKNTAYKYMKETNSHPFIGTMADESRLRKTNWIKNGCNAFHIEHPQSTLFSFWTEQDILQYIKQYDLKIADVYGDIVYVDEDGMFYDNAIFNESMKLTTTGESRTGCVFCLYGIQNDTERLIRLKEYDKKKYDYVMRGGCFNSEGLWIPGKDENGVFGLGYKFVIDWVNEHGGFNIKY